MPWPAWNPAVTIDPKTVHTRYESRIGEKYLDLVSSCFSWADESKMNLLTEQTLPNADKLGSFQSIWKIHDELRKDGRPDCVPGFLLNLVDGGYGNNFMIPYVYIKRTIPVSGYNRIFLNFVCRTDELPALLDKLGIYPPNSDAISAPKKETS
jgi:hypothetical protein